MIADLKGIPGTHIRNMGSFPRVIRYCPPPKKSRLERLLERVFEFCARHGRVRMIYRNVWGSDEPYLERAYLFRTKWFGIFLHRFYLSDEMGLHNHPWNFLAMPLVGHYLEHLPGGLTKLRRPWRPQLRTAREFHRVEVPLWETPGRVYTLFVRGRRQQRWGFLTRNQDAELELMPEDGRRWDP